MSVKWHLPQGQSPGSIEAFGRQLRDRFAMHDVPEDRKMRDLMERLCSIPAVGGGR